MVPEPMISYMVPELIGLIKVSRNIIYMKLCRQEFEINTYDIYKPYKVMFLNVLYYNLLLSYKSLHS